MKLPASKTHLIVAASALFGLAACTVVTTTPVDPYPELTKALNSDAPYRCAVACDVHEDFALQDLEPEEARRRIEEHNAGHHHGGTNHTTAQCAEVRDD